MTDSQLPETTECGSRGNVGRYNSETLPPAEHVSFNQEQVGKRFGWVIIMSAERRYPTGWQHPYVKVQCQGCGSIHWCLWSNLRTGRTQGCQSCSQPRQLPKWLDRRLTAARQRCTNPSAPGYPSYGGRGIRFEFPSILEAGLWMLENLGTPDKDREIDRIDNNGHYAPGNLRWATRQENSGNRRNSRLSEWDQKYWPYAKNTIRRKLSEGETREQIIAEAELAVVEKRKSWRTIQQRLGSMTYSMPDHVTVSPRTTF